MSIPRSVWALGFVSMFMDMSSEMIHALLPVYLVTTLSASAMTVGIIEGIAEATASITKLFSGTLSDYLGKRKLLTLVGYGMAALTKPLFPLASSAGLVFTARFIDRIGKGIRGAPRDALVADVTPPHLRGASYGLRQSLDTVGAFCGPMLAIILMYIYNDMRTVFWFAVIPAAICVVILYWGVQEPEIPLREEADKPSFRGREILKLHNGYWVVILVSVLLNLARFSEAFLVLRAQERGLSIHWVPLILVVMNIIYAASSYPAGKLSDIFSRKCLMRWGIAMLVLSHLVLAGAGSVTMVFVGTLLWGLHMGLTQGIFSAMIADTSPAHLHGTAFGVFNISNGVAMLGASILAGWLWEDFGAGVPFFAGAICAMAAWAFIFRLPRNSDAVKSG